MKNNILIFVIVILMSIFFSYHVHAEFNDWNDTQKGLSYSYVGFVAVDLIQSQHWIEYTEDDPRETEYGTIHENNKLVSGKSIEEVTFITIAVHYLSYKLLDDMDSKNRTFILVTANLIEGYNIYTNHEDMIKHNLNYRINILNIEF